MSNDKFILSEELFQYIIDPKLSNHAAGVLPLCKYTKRFLIAKRGPKISLPNKWANWGGGHGWYEDAKTTAVREFYEESGTRVPIKMIPSFVDEHEDGFKYHNFIGIVDFEFKPLVNVVTVDGDIEVADYKWVTLQQLLKMPSNTIHFGIIQLLKKARKQIEEIIEKDCVERPEYFLKENDNFDGPRTNPLDGPGDPPSAHIGEAADIRRILSPYYEVKHVHDPEEDVWTIVATLKSTDLPSNMKQKMQLLRNEILLSVHADGDYDRIEFS